MLGAIAGDIIGSTREHHSEKTLDFELLPEGCRVTDDSVVTIATTQALLTDQDLGKAWHRWRNRHRQE